MPDFVRPPAPPQNLYNPGDTAQAPSTPSAPTPSAPTPSAAPPQGQSSPFARPDPRRTYTFTIPQSARVGQHDPQSVTLKELSPDEVNRARGKKTEGPDAAIKASIYAVDGVPVNQAEFQEVAYWASWSAKVRVLVSLGFARIHNTNDEEDAAFLGSMVLG